MLNKNYDCKHLTTTQRIMIEKGLLDDESFAAIARKIKKHPSTVAKEVKKYRYFPERDGTKIKLPCALKKTVRFVSYVTKRIALNSARAAIIHRAKRTAKNFVLITL